MSSSEKGLAHEIVREKFYIVSAIDFKCETNPLFQEPLRLLSYKTFIVCDFVSTRTRYKIVRGI